jgi:hypothetical protein
MKLGLVILLLFVVQDWPQFRGPTGQGVSEETGLPLTWSENKNLSEEGESVVIAPGRQLKHLATNQLDGPTLASIAISDRSLFIRSSTHLYRISNN